MAGTVNQYSQIQSATIAGGTALSGPIRMDQFSRGNLITPATLNATTKLAFKISSDDGTTWFDLRTAANALFELTVDLAGAHAYPLPAELAGARMFKIWAEASGSDVNQTGDKVFTLLLKS